MIKAISLLVLVITAVSSTSNYKTLFNDYTAIFDKIDSDKYEDYELYIHPYSLTLSNIRLYKPVNQNAQIMPSTSDAGTSQVQINNYIIYFNATAEIMVGLRNSLQNIPVQLRFEYDYIKFGLNYNQKKTNLFDGSAEVSIYQDFGQFTTHLDGPYLNRLRADFLKNIANGITYILDTYKGYFAQAATQYYQYVGPVRTPVANINIFMTDTNENRTLNTTSNITNSTNDNRTNTVNSNRTNIKNKSTSNETVENNQSIWSNGVWEDHPYVANTTLTTASLKFLQT